MKLSERLDALGVNLTVSRPEQPTVIDSDDGEITVELPVGTELRGWCYRNEDERRMKMLCAREYVEGWCDGIEKIFSRLDELIGTDTSRPPPST